MPYRQDGKERSMYDDYDEDYNGTDYISDHDEFMLDWAKKEGNFDYSETPDWSKLLK